MRPGKQKIVLKLPEWVVTRWSRVVARHGEEQQQFPPFDTFVSFVTKEADIACDPVTSLQSLRPDRDVKPERQRPSGRTLLTEVKQGSSAHSARSNVTCVLCHKVHDLDDCRQFLAKPMDKRQEFIKLKRLCFGCLGTDHLSRRCNERKHCKTCKKSHLTSVHGYIKPLQVHLPTKSHRFGKGQ